MALKWLKNWLDSIKKGQLIALFLPILSYGQFPSAKDCNTAYRICDATASYHFVADTSYGLIDDANGLDYVFCVWQGINNPWEWHPAWFTFTPQYSGQFGFLICPDNPTTDWQWELFENPVCGNLSDTSHHVLCNTQSPAPVADGCTGIGFKGIFWGGGTNGLATYINVTAGNTYVLYCSILRWDLTTPEAATLTFQGSVVTAHPDLFNYPGCTMSTQEFIKDNTKVFPNPFTNRLRIESETNFKTMALYDVLGKQIINQKFANELNTSALSQGVYFLHLIDNEGNKVVKKVVRE